MITCEAFVAWRLERTDLASLFGRGVDVGWEARPGGGVVVVRNLVGGERLTYRTLDEAGGFVDGFHWGGVSREAVPAVQVTVVNSDHCPACGGAGDGEDEQGNAVGCGACNGSGWAA